MEGLKYKVAFATKFVKHWHLRVEQWPAHKFATSLCPDAGNTDSVAVRTPDRDKPATIAKLLANYEQDFG